VEKVRVGVIGVGHLGFYHVLNYKRIPDVELIGIFDKNNERADEVSSESQCKAFSNLDSLLNEVEAVSIAVPTDQHFKIGQKVLEKKIHCMMEKPITQTIEQADELIRIANCNNLVLQIGHIERFNPAILALHDFNLQPQFIESHRLAQFNPRGTEVAVVLDLMIHDIDIILHLVNSSVKQVDARGVAVVSDAVDIANARILFNNGCVANLTASRISQKKMRKMRLFQKETYISIDFLQKRTEIYQLKDEDLGEELIVGEIGVGERKKKIVYNVPNIPEINSLQKELEAFIRTVKGEKVTSVTCEAGREALSVALSILKNL
jgi:predicted dehydrogenase